MSGKVNLSRLHDSLILTWNCNLHCRHCRPYLPPDFSLSPSNAKKYIDALVQKGSLFLHLTGGEPLMHGDFWEITTYAHRQKFALILHTNGTLITTDIGDKLKQLNFIHVFLTILGAKSETHDSLTGVRGSFEKTILTFQILKEIGVKVSLTSTRLKENLDEIPEMERLAKKTGTELKIVSFQPLDRRKIEDFNRCYQRNFQRS